MDFTENENTEALRDLLRRFLDKEVPPQMAARWDQEDHIPREMLDRLAELGLCGLTVPEEYGGMGRDVRGMVTTIQELARRSVVLAGRVHHERLLRQPQHRRGPVPRSRSGSFCRIFARARSCSPTDFPSRMWVQICASVTTRAERRGDRVIINGYKRWCSGAGFADYIYMLVRSGEPKARYKNLSLILVPPRTPGITLHHIGTLGVRGIPTNDVILEDVEIPFANVIGGEASWNRGWSLLAGTYA